MEPPPCPIYVLTPSKYLEAVETLRKKLPALEVRDSPGKGLGVFARERIQKGRFVTFYPEHFHSTEVSDTQCSISGPRSAMDAVGDRLDDLARRYSIRTGVARPTSFIGDPSRLDAGFLGHMINDGARSRTPEDQAVYLRISLLRQNVDSATLTDGERVSVVYRATADIDAGQELLSHYGCAFWRGQ